MITYELFSCITLLTSKFKLFIELFSFEKKELFINSYQFLMISQNNWVQIITSITEEKVFAKS